MSIINIANTDITLNLYFILNKSSLYRTIQENLTEIKMGKGVIRLLWNGQEI